MQLFTYSDFKTKLGNDYDIADWYWVTETELVGYINDAIDDAETAIHTMHWEDKYFLVPSTVTFVSGTQDYAMPSDIYANKIRSLWYVNGADKYQIERLTRLEEVPFVEDSDSLRYIIINTTASGVKMRFYPIPAVNGAYGQLWYIRNMKRVTTSLVDATNICEVPESFNFVVQHVKKSLAKKTRRPELIAQEDADLKIQYQLMLDALKDMTLDEQNLIPMDLSSYYDQDNYL